MVVAGGYFASGNNLPRVPRRVERCARAARTLNGRLTHGTFAHCLHVPRACQGTTSARLPDRWRHARQRQRRRPAARAARRRAPPPNKLAARPTGTNGFTRLLVWRRRPEAREQRSLRRVRCAPAPPPERVCAAPAQDGCAWRGHRDGAAAGPAVLVRWRHRWRRRHGRGQVAEVCRAARLGRSVSPCHPRVYALRHRALLRAPQAHLPAALDCDKFWNVSEYISRVCVRLCASYLVHIVSYRAPYT